MLSNLIYVIYDIENFSILSVFRTEKECISCFKEMYEGYVNVNWVCFNLSHCLKVILKDPYAEDF